MVLGDIKFDNDLDSFSDKECFFIAVTSISEAFGLGFKGFAIKTWGMGWDLLKIREIITKFLYFLIVFFVETVSTMFQYIEIENSTLVLSYIFSPYIKISEFKYFSITLNIFKLLKNLW